MKESLVMSLEEEFKRIKENHRKAIRTRVARVCFSGSTGRVFESRTSNKIEDRTSTKIKKVLLNIDIDHLLNIKSQEHFKRWFETNLDSVFNAIPEKTSHGNTISIGARRWGYATKILNLYLRDMFENCRYFTYEQAERVIKFLYVPFDRIVMGKLQDSGVPLPFSQINEIDTPEKFYSVQNLLEEGAQKAGVPRVWFDDNWGDRK
jgi:hypothetical protein